MRTAVCFIRNIGHHARHVIEENTRRRCANHVFIVTHQEKRVIARRSNTISDVQGPVYRKFHRRAGQKITRHSVRIIAVTAIVHIK